MSSLKADVTEKLLKVYSGISYKYTETVNHGGTIIAFAMDEHRRIFYAVLENETDSVEKGEFDTAFWPEEPHHLDFPREIGRVGFSIVGSTLIPDVHLVSKEEKAQGEIEENDRHKFLSSTARFSALAPFKPFSDGKYVYLFRQAIDSNDSDQLYKLSRGGVTSSTSREASEYILDGTEKIPVVNKTLLCDRFVLAGGELKQAQEVRYRRSRHATNPASSTDALGATDMEGGKFYVPTQELAFVKNLSRRRFSVVQLPTAISGSSRWHIMVHNGATDRIDMFNMEVSKDGMFNLKGSQLYTSPEAQYRKSVLERTPGTCPFSDKPLIPLAITSGHAETCMMIRDTNGHAGGTISGWNSTTFTVEAWVKSNVNLQAEWRGFQEGNTLFTSHTSNHSGKFMIELNRAGNWTFRFPNGNTNKDFGVGYSHEDWVHLAVTYDGTTVRGYVDGVEKFSAVTSMSVHVGNIRIGAGDNGTECFKGKVDEVRLWSMACLKEQIQARRMTRLIGMELNLVGYWTFDEGMGSSVSNQVDGEAKLTMSGGVKFVPSDCPIGANNGTRRDSFSIFGRTISGGVSSCLYFQQEKMATGYDGESKPMKKQSRLLMCIGTTDSEGSNPILATLDVGVSKYGRIAQFPDVVSLSTVLVPENVKKRMKLREIDNKIEELRSELDMLTAIGSNSTTRTAFLASRNLSDALIAVGLTSAPRMVRTASRRVPAAAAM